jgi:hypothetical protein
MWLPRLPPVPAGSAAEDTNDPKPSITNNSWEIGSEQSGEDLNCCPGGYRKRKLSLDQADLSPPEVWRCASQLRVNEQRHYEEDGGRPERVEPYGSLANSDLACRRTGMSGLASFQRERKSW